MNAAGDHAIPPHTLTLLRQFLSRSRSTLSPQEVVKIAIDEWIERQRKAEPSTRGYQWKELFLPEGTEIRMTSDGKSHYAKVANDKIIFRQRPTTPRGITLAVAGDGRNAWRDLWLLLPGERNWINAARLRAQQNQQLDKLPTSQADTLHSAAKAMSQALNAAVLLIQHVDHQSTTILERRLPKNRREYDTLEDIH
ncbi:hypothetical protein GJ699_15070 [Duganella sp. FT80W]|uniref:Uncharacterized protein n=1 Tax=Duganella guangzhouensis TaxID=2666084 RepID=A0A6I2L0G8_9BURK|nr:hypothetical protein [Duganella guangzhouensis]MRW91312.1 hypothetical protein [Duganella guangzhouensis]